MGAKMSSAISGKYFLGVHYDCMRSGIVEAAVNDGHYLVRFDDLIGFGDGSRRPEAQAVVAIADMVGSGDEDGPPPWWFFDNFDQRAKYDAWLNERPADLKARVVPLRRGTQKEG
jgi:hypothetical protein